MLRKFSMLQAAAAILFSVGSADARFPACPGGVFLATPSPLIGAGTGDEGTLLLRGTEVSIGTACGPVTAKVRGARSGTKITATFPSCNGLPGKVRLALTIDPSCGSITKGTLSAPRFRRRFTAVSHAPMPVVTVDPSLAPPSGELPGSDGAARPVSTMIDASGIRSDFVSDELVIETGDSAELNRVVQRLGGEVLDSFTPSEVGLAGTPQHLVRLGSRGRTPEEAARVLRENDGFASGEYRVSDAGALDVLVAAAEERRQGVKVAMNFVARSDGLIDGETFEAGNSSTASWSHLMSFGVQDIGVVDAWKALALAGKLGNRVPIAILDQGFAPSADFPVNTQAISLIAGRPALNQRNLALCSGGGSCPWHGRCIRRACFSWPPPPMTTRT